MATFPALKTGAVAQYGSDRSRIFSTQVLRFLDGSEQRFAEFGTPLMQWVIRLDLLDESELTNLEQFFEDEGGLAGTFSFTDPWDGTVYANCSFGDDQLATQYGGTARGAARSHPRTPHRASTGPCAAPGGCPSMRTWNGTAVPGAAGPMTRLRSRAWNR